jgi:hypothetical protein
VKNGGFRGRPSMAGHAGKNVRASPCRHMIRKRIPVAVPCGGGYIREQQFAARRHRDTIATAEKSAAQFLGL